MEGLGKISQRYYHAGCFSENSLVSNADLHTFIEMGDSLIGLGHRNNKTCGSL
jgi:hypothetical protein